MTDQNEAPVNTATTEEGVPPLAAEAVLEAKAVKAAEKRRLAGLSSTQIGIGVGVGSAALLAALLYTRRSRKK